MSPVKLAKRVAGTGVNLGVQLGTQVGAQAVRYLPQGRQAYEDTLRTLSEASVDQCFNAFKDIAWDAPEMSVEDNHDWVLPDVDPIGHTDWYKSLPRERQVAIARHRLAAITKTGSQFEQLLLVGGTQFLLGLGNSNPEFRYFMHELTEETHHIQMFQEFTNRVCPEVSGAPRWFVKALPAIGLLGSLWPTLFFQIILAGEEPIDYVQKDIMRNGGIHPLLDRVMQIHIAEEARHIGFAHSWLEHHIPEMGPLTKLTLGALTPLLMVIGFVTIIVPSRADQQAMGIPDHVMREAFGRNSELLGKTRRDMCADVRMLCEDTGLLNPITRLTWKLLGVDGRPSRYRAQPSSAAA